MCTLLKSLANTLGVEAIALQVSGEIRTFNSDSDWDQEFHQGLDSDQDLD